jgi:hypothetical protein
VEARDVSDTARREAEQLLAAAHAGAAAPEAQPEPDIVEPAEPEPVAESEAEAPAEPEAPGERTPPAGFTPPPSSLEDLAAASRPTKFSMRGRHGNK